MGVEVIDLLSDSEPETAKTVPNRDGARTNRISKTHVNVGGGSEGVKSAVTEALESNWGFGGRAAGFGEGGVVERRGADVVVEVKGKEVVVEVKPKEKEKEMTEVEKIRELRLKRFGGSGNFAGIPASEVGTQSTQTTVKPAEQQRNMVESNNNVASPMVSRVGVKVNAGKGKSAQGSTMKSTLRGGFEAPTSAIEDSYGVFDDDDLISPLLPSNVIEKRRSTTFTNTEMKDLTQDSDGEDPFRDLPTLPKQKDNWKSNTSKASRNLAIDVECNMEADFSDDPFSPMFVAQDKRSSNAAGKKKATAVVDDDFDFSFNDSYDKPRKSVGTSMDLISSDPFKWDDIDAPEPKRRKFSNEPMTSGTSARSKEAGGYRRTVSNIGTTSNASKPKASGLKRAKTMDSDPIVFTSSIEYKSKKVDKRKDHYGSDDFIDIDDLPSIKKPSASVSVKAGIGRSNLRDADLLLSDLYHSSSDLEPISALAIPKRTTSESTTRSRDASITSPPRLKPKGKSANAALDAYEKEKRAEKKAQEKAQKEADKLAAKEAAKEQKRVEKENKAKEKEVALAFSKVNTLKTDKKNSTPEMIVDFPTNMDETLVDATCVWLKDLNVETGTWDSPIPNVVKFRRKVQAEWDEATDCWRPVAPHIKREKIVIVIIKAEEFLNLIHGEEGKDLVCHALRMKGQFESDKFGVPHRGDAVDKRNIIYLIEGLSGFIKKNKKAKNRRFAEAVRNQIDGGEASGGNKRKRKADEVREIDEGEVEDALMELQVLYGVLVYETGAVAETAQWIGTFVQHISSIPYRQQKSLSLHVCLDPGQIKSGANPEETFIRMLQETTRLTAPIAYGIVSKYPSAPKLIRAFEKAEEEEGRESAMRLLEDLKKCSNRDGGFTQGRVGKALSARVWRVFMGGEEGSCDI